MNARLTAIARRRTTLVAQAAGQRDELGRLMRPWQRRLALADRGMAFVRQLLHGHPFAIAVGVALLTRMRHGRLGVWGGRLWIAGAVYRSLRNHRRER